MSKLASICIVPFAIINKISPITHRLEIPPNFAKIHKSIHTSLLNKYVHYPSHIGDEYTLYMEKPLAMEVHLIQVLDLGIKKLYKYLMN